MSGLFTSLGVAVRSLEAQQLGMEIAGQNMANLNTPGYSRRSVNLSEVPPGSAPGRGVEVVGIQAHRDEILESRLRTELTLEQEQDAISQSLGLVEVSLGEPGASIDGQLAAFFDAFSAVAENPLSLTARQGVLSRGRELTRSFHDMAARLADAAKNADNQVRVAVDEINRLSKEVTDLNAAIRSANGKDVESLKDQRHQALKDLSKIAPVQVIGREDGSIDLALEGGGSLVVGGFHYPLEVGASPSGQAVILSHDVDVTAKVTGGRLGGLLHVRDDLVPSYSTTLDQVAYDLATAVNTIHEAGTTGAATTGQRVFDPLGGVVGAATSITLDAALAADANLVAASQTGEVGDNQTAVAIANLRYTKVSAGGTATLTDLWAQLVFQVGTDLRSADLGQKSRAQMVASVERMRDAVSGVSLDEEAATLLKYQRAYDANARFFTAINDTLDVLLSLGGR